MRILTLDIETRPLTVHAWGIREQNIGINQILDAGGVLCWAAKFQGERKVHFAADWEGGEKAMLKKVHALLCEADAVVGWNSDRFDCRWLNGQFVKHDMARPEPYDKVDLMKSVRFYQYLPSYKLDYVSRSLGIGQKVKTGGFDLWTDCMAGCEKARKRMRAYNIADVKLTEAVFDKLRSKGWVRGLPNRSLDGGHVCPHCGSEKLQARGYNHSKTRSYQRWQCRECYGWSQSVKSQPWAAQLKGAA